MERLSKSPIGSFAPWIVYWVVADSRSTWEFGAITAAIISGLLLLPSLERGGVKTLDVLSFGFFVVIAVVGAVSSPHDGDWMDRWSQVLSSGALAVFVLVTIPFMPFTEQYARESAPPEVWNTPRFRRTNLVLTTMWGLVFAAEAALGVIAREAPGSAGWTNWVLPICLIVAAFKFTARYSAQAREAAQRRAQPAARGRSDIDARVGAG
jgi:hypothetical protein